MVEGILQAASVGLCRLREEKDGKMEVVCLRLLKGLHHKFKVGAVSGSTLYLTSLMPPVLGNILSIDLTTDVEPEVITASCNLQILTTRKVLHHVVVRCMKLLPQRCY